MDSKKSESSRYEIVDAIRGIAIVNMVLYHFFYDYKVIFGGDGNWDESICIRIWQSLICYTFIIVSGFVWSLSASKALKRGIKINLLGLLITVVTIIFIPDEAIFMGILNFFGCAVILMIPAEKVLKKMNVFIGLFLNLFLFIIFLNLKNGYISFLGSGRVYICRCLYDIKVLTPFGMPYGGFRSSDYFPLIPWFFLYIFGYYLYAFTNEKKQITNILRKKIPILSYVGKKSLYIYILHQPICMLVSRMIYFLKK